MNKKILVVLTSVEKYPNLNRATGLWLGEAVHFVKKVEAAGCQVDYVSPRGAIYKKADKAWAPFTVADGRVITGQNPASGGAVADLLLAELKRS